MSRSHQNDFLCVSFKTVHSDIQVENVMVRSLLNNFFFLHKYIKFECALGLVCHLKKYIIQLNSDRQVNTTRNRKVEIVYKVKPNYPLVDVSNDKT